MRGLIELFSIAIDEKRPSEHYKHLSAAEIRDLILKDPTLRKTFLAGDAPDILIDVVLEEGETKMVYESYTDSSGKLYEWMVKRVKGLPNTQAKAEHAQGGK